MSEVVEEKIDINEISTNVENREEIKDVVKEELNKEVIKTFVQSIQFFLTQDTSNLEKMNINLTPEIQQYFLLLCKEMPDIFGSFELSLKNIILDNKINTKDIPDILVLVSKIYNTVNSNKSVSISDPYELIRMLLHIVFVVYLETNNVNNSEFLLEALKIVDSSIELIKLTPLVPKKNGCFNKLFRC